jgi:tetratricopeptide (TPR) repeat protein
MFFKVIIQGNLQFANEKSYLKLVKMIENRNEVYYKNLIIHKELEFLDNEHCQIIIPRHVGNYSDKVWKNSISLFQNCAEFAVSGRIMAWKIEAGEVLEFENIEPTGDRSAVMHFKKGKKFIEAGERDKAMKSLSLSLEKHQKNALAYERRAVVNLMQKNFAEAMRDFNKCLRIDPTVSEAHYGIAKLLMRNEEFDEALPYVENTIKNSIALQAIHWKARRAKSQIHYKKKEYEKAAFELKLLAKRRFSENNPNYAWKRADVFNYGRTLFELEEYEQAIVQIELSIKIQTGRDNIRESEKYYYLALAKQKGGKNGYLSDLKEASRLGEKRAAKLLEELV